MDSLDLALIVGGIRSGKSTWAERLALESACPRFYLATTQNHGSDPEMAERVRQHQKRRESQDWTATIEESHDLLGVFAKAPVGSTWLLECLPLWLAANAFQTSDTLCDESWVHQRCWDFL